MVALTQHARACWFLSAAPALVVLSAMAYWRVCTEIDRTKDEGLQQSASALTHLAGSLGDRIQDLGSSVARSPVLDASHADGGPTSFSAQYWNSDNRLILASGELANLPLDATPPGYSDIEREGRRWRVLSRLDDHRHWLRVAEPYQQRNAIKQTFAMQIAADALIGMLVIALIAHVALRRTQRALRTLAERIDERPGKTEPMGASGLPAEFDPVVAALNSLLMRLRKCPHPETHDLPR